MAELASTKPKWEFFLNSSYCEDEMHEMYIMYPQKKHVTIDHRLMFKFDLDIAEELLERPDAALTVANNALNELIDGVDDFKSDCYIRVSHLPEYVKKYLKNIRDKDLSELLLLSGAVRRVGKPHSKYDMASFECKRCGHITNVTQSGKKLVKPLECENEQCGRQGPFNILVHESDRYDAQIIFIQEHTDNMDGGEEPRVLPIHIDRELVGKFRPGNKVNCSGIIRLETVSSNKVQDNEMEFYIEGQNMTVVDDENDTIIISPEEQIEYEYLSQHPDIIQFLIESFAPFIIRADYIKLGLMSSIVSGPNLISEGKKIERRYSHSLLCGDPGTGKSQLLKYACDLVPRAQFTTGEGSTVVGLTAAVVRDDITGTGWAVDAGALVLADRALAVIDEMDALGELEVKALNTALSDSFVEIHKAGINTRLPCREPVLVGLNPIEGRFDRYEEIPKQINIKPDTLSRFDLIFTLFDIPDPEFDMELRKAILYEGEYDTSLSFDELQNYLHLARSIQDVELSDEASFIIGEFFSDLRSEYEENQVVSITSRHLEGLKRITRSIAKLHLTSVATAKHAKIAVDLLHNSFETFLFDKVRGVIDADICETGLSHSQRDRLKLFKDIIRDLQHDHKGVAPDVELMKILTKEGFSDIDIQGTIKRLKRTGELFQPRDGVFKLSS